MANRTVKEAKNVHGTNPQYLIEKIIRSRIYDSKYWKEQCFALTAELLVDKAMELRFIGGVYGGNIKPTQFLCLTLKMLQIQPEKDIVVEFIKNEEFKYVRALGAFYLRLTGTALDCYKYLEPLYNDNRKLRRQNRSGQFEIVYMDDFIDELLRSDRVCDIILPRIQKRSVLEENNELEPKVSALDEDLDEEIPSEDEAEKEEILKKSKHKKKERSRSRSIEKDRKRDETKKDLESEKKKIFEREKNRDRQVRERDREREKERRKYEKERDRKDHNYRNDRDVERDYRIEKEYRNDRDYREDVRKDREKERRRY
ncbi:pre-mRNA-splicing factor 38 [Condylostylus longicornis]|uniref:pre-mRNA-splicing factor 38 n=1 Tax=Condylostylus longicornis TaxID=2530218 RepID=UPI00244E5277|nr:pre-mRNA-splicing factor 38 [Condylostylus longicornis]